MPTRVGKKKKKTKGPDAASKLPLGNDVVPVPGGRRLCVQLRGGVWTDRK